MVKCKDTFGSTIPAYNLIIGHKSNRMTRQRNYLLTLLNNQNMMLEQQKTELDSSGNAMKRYQVYAESTSAKVADFKNTLQQFWMSLINSKAINSFIGFGTQIINIFQIITQQSIGTKIAMVATIIAITTLLRNLVPVIISLGSAFAKGNSSSFLDGLFKLILGKGVTAGAIMENLTKSVSSLGKALVALFTTPAGWAILLGVAVIALATTAIIKHIQHVKELKEQTDSLSISYKNLTTAMQENNNEAMKSEYDKLKTQQDSYMKLLQQKAKIESEINRVQSESDPLSNDGSGYIEGLKVQLNGLNKTIDEQKKVMDGAGISADTLVQAELQMGNNKITENIKSQAEEETKNKDAILNLANEYIKLNDVENKNSIQKQRMSQLSDELNGKIKGLILSKDTEGNVTIKNVDYLNNEIGALNTDKDATQTLANVKLTSAKNTAQILVNGQKLTYEVIKQNIENYKAEAMALDALAKKKQQASGAMEMSMIDDNGKLVTVTNKVSQLNQGVGEFQQALNTLDKIYAIPEISGITNSSNSGAGYIPPNSSASKDKSKSSKSPAEVQSINNEVDTTKTALSEVTDLIARQEKSLTNLSTTAKKYADAKDYANAIKSENTLLTAQQLHQKELQTALAKTDTIKNQIKSAFYNQGISGVEELTSSQLDEIWNSRYGGNHDFGEGEQAKKAKESFEANGKILKTLMDDWKSYGDTADKVGQSIIDNNNDILATQNEILDIKFKVDDSSLNDILNKEKLINNELDLHKEKTTEAYGEEVRIRQSLNGEYIKENQFLKNNIDALRIQRDSLPILSTEWDKINERIGDYNDKLQQSNMKLIENAKATKEAALNEVYKAFENSIYDGSREDYERDIKAKNAHLQDRLDKMKEANDLEKEQEDREEKLKDIALVKKQINALQSTTLANMTKEQAKSLELEQEREDVLKHQTELLELQTELQNTLKEKNIRQLTENTDGSYEWKYVVDQKKVDEINKQINDKQTDFNKSLETKKDNLNKTLKDKQTEFNAWERENERQQEEQSLQDQIKHNEDELRIRDEYFNTMKEKLRINYDKDNPDSITNVIAGGFDNIKEVNGIKMGGIIDDIKDNVKTANAELSKLSTILSDAQSMASQVSSLASSSGSSGSSKDESFTVNTDIDRDMLRNSGYKGEINVDYGKGERGVDRYETLEKNKKKLNRLETGGQLSDWGSQPKLALLDQGEVVIKSPIIKALEKLPEFVNSDKNILSTFVSKLNLPDFSSIKGNANRTMQQTIQKVECNFPNITSTDGLRETLLSLPQIVNQQMKTVY